MESAAPRTQPKASVNRLREFLLAGLLLAAIWIAYLPVLRAGYVWDDKFLVTENPLVTSNHALPIWWTASSADYTPLTISSFWMEWHLWGANPLGYHLVNLALHSIAVLLLWKVLRQLGIPGAWLGALLFAVHPVNAASVAWIAERKNTLSLVFYLCAILCHLEFDLRRTRLTQCLAILCGALAFLAKGSTVILPAVLLFCIWWRHRRIQRQALVDIAPLAALAGIMALVTVHFQARIIRHGAAEVTPWFRIARAGEAIWFYLWKDLWPINLCPVYPKWPVHENSVIGYIPVFIAIAGLLIASRIKAARGVVFAAACYLASLLPVLGFVNMTFLDQAYVADWWQQLALIPVAALAGATAMMGNVNRLLRGAAIACVVVFLISRTFGEASSYQSMEIFCRHALAMNPLSWAAHDNLGNVLQAQGRLPEAITEYERALQIEPSSSTAEGNLGSALQAQGKIGEAISHYQRALALDANDLGVYNNYAFLLEGRGQTDAAIDLFRRALRINPALPEVHNNLALALKRKGQLQAAAVEFREALRLRPAYADAYSNLGDTLLELGDNAGAEAACRRALRLKPGFPDAMNNLGNVLLARNRLGEAIEEYDKVLQQNPDDAKALYNLGLASHKLGKLDEAISHYQAALRIQPGMTPATLNLAQAYASQHRLPEALACLDQGIAAAESPADRDSMLSLRKELLENSGTP